MANTLPDSFNYYRSVSFENNEYIILVDNENKFTINGKTICFLDRTDPTQIKYYLKNYTARLSISKEEKVNLKSECILAISHWNFTHWEAYSMECKNKLVTDKKSE